MLRFANLDEFKIALGGALMWRRAADAILRADLVQPEVTHSIGDSLTYRVTSRSDRAELTGHRRYLEVRAVLDSTVVIEIAPVRKLEATDAYSDLTDRQHFAGTGERHELAAGEIVVVEPDEAVRDVEVTGRMLVLRVTVESP